MNLTVKFDPGMGEYFENFNEYINNLYSQLLSITSISKKRIKFKMSLSKIDKMMKNNLGFYTGCLLWAYYIYNNNISSPKEIEGNYFYLKPDEQAHKDFECQINFMENYFDSYERDVLYYTGQKVKIPESWRTVLSQYNEFLKLNKCFVETKYTSDIILPEPLKNIKTDTDINKLINEAITKKDLSLLLSVNIFN